jgi:hypothetical protein
MRIMQKEKLKLRIWWIRNPPRDADYYSVDNIEEAIAKLNKLAQQDLGNKLITSNAAGLEVLEDGKWTEYYDEENRDINEIRRDINEEEEGE